ncbi:MAG: hypothetical protein J3T61_09255, partial [Candidatus Brocadiales bacterium]|nr:hypothetical protein [Candidatus Bathyanammoxibius sp.]
MPENFRDQFAALFGKAPQEYDPVEWGEKPKERALNTQENVPGIDIAGERRRVPYKAPQAIDPEATPKTDFLKSGTALLGEAVVGVAEYGSRQLGATDTAESLRYTRGLLADYRQKIYDDLPAEIMQMKNAEFLTLDPDKTIWKGVGNVFESILYKFTESIPMMVPTMLPGAVLFRAGLSAKAITALGASEGVLSLGFIANDIEDGIMQIYTEKGAEGLAAEAPNFAKYLETMDEQTALMKFVAEAQGIAPIVGGIAVGAISAAAGKYIAPVFEGGAGLSWMGRIGRGAVSEGVLQEGPQEVVEQVAQNIAAAVYDGDRDALEGVAESYVQGMVVGMPGGGLFGGLAGKGGEIDPATEPQDTDQPGAPSSFRDVFGEEVPPPDDGGWRGAPASDLFPTPIDITDDTVPPDQAAAIAAAMRTDEVMGDTVENIESATPGAQAQQNLPMPGGGMNAQGREVATVPQQPPTLEGQGELPLVQKQRGGPPAPIPGAAPQPAPVAPVPGAVAPVPTEQQGDLY